MFTRPLKLSYTQTMGGLSTQQLMLMPIYYNHCSPFLQSVTLLAWLPIAQTSRNQEVKLLAWKLFAAAPSTRLLSTCTSNPTCLKIQRQITKSPSILTRFMMILSARFRTINSYKIRTKRVSLILSKSNRLELLVAMKPV